MRARPRSLTANTEIKMTRVSSLILLSAASILLAAPALAKISVQSGENLCKSEISKDTALKSVKADKDSTKATGAAFVKSETDCLALFEEKLAARGLITREGADAMRTGFTAELLEASKRVIAEPQPDSSTIWDHVYATKNLVGER